MCTGGKGQEPCSRDSTGEQAAIVNREHHVVLAVDDERRRRDLTEHLGSVVRACDLVLAAVELRIEIAGEALDDVLTDTDRTTAPGSLGVEVRHCRPQTLFPGHVSEAADELAGRTTRWDIQLPTRRRRSENE
jgi:hypothetical protein